MEDRDKQSKGKMTQERKGKEIKELLKREIGIMCWNDETGVENESWLLTFMNLGSIEEKKIC